VYKVTKLLSAADASSGRREGRREERREGRREALARAGACACIETRRAGRLGLGGSFEAWFDGPEAAAAYATDDTLHGMLWSGGVPDVLPVTEPHVVLGPSELEPVSDGLKGIFVFRRKAGMPIPAFQSHWLHTHGPIAARTPCTTRYVQCHVLPSCYEDGSPPYDGITELYWATLDDARVAMSSDSMTVEQSADAQNFVDGDSVKLVIVSSDRLI
jgi:uncharacterized protein (TIGR02118 family)